jgi:hypothetical protein
MATTPLPPSRIPVLRGSRRSGVLLTPPSSADKAKAAPVTPSDTHALRQQERLRAVEEARRRFLDLDLSDELAVMRSPIDDAAERRMLAALAPGPAPSPSPPATPKAPSSSATTTWLLNTVYNVHRRPAAPPARVLTRTAVLGPHTPRPQDGLAGP